MGMSHEQLKSILVRYMPETVVDYAAVQLITHSVQLRIARPRKSKFGDYRPPAPGELHRISVNADLNPYAFTVTFFHEIAHLTNWNRHANRVNPHGPEWKDAFRQIMKPLTGSTHFPQDISQALDRYLSRPAASTCSDPNLYRTLRRYDLSGNQHLVEDIPMGTVFVLNNGLVLRKGPRLRTRYECREQGTGRMYHVPGLATAHIVTE